MKLILFLVGFVLSLWVGFTVYHPANTFITSVQKVYLQSRAVQSTVQQKSGTVVNVISEKYQEIARIFGVKVAEEEAKKEIIGTQEDGKKDPIEKLFEHNIALWISAFAGFMTLSIYCNILSLIAFFLKPVTFFIKK